MSKKILLKSYDYYKEYMKIKEFRQSNDMPFDKVEEFKKKQEDMWKKFIFYKEMEKRVNK